MKAPLAILCVLLGLVPLAEAQPARTAPKKGVPARVAQLFNAVESDDHFDAARAGLLSLFDEVIAFAPTSDTEAFREAAFSQRLIALVAASPTGQRARWIEFFRRHPSLAENLAFLIKPEDKLPAVLLLLDRLRDKHPDLESFPALAAAICVVHDETLSHRINENTATAVDPVDLFGYFKSLRTILGTPPELLINVVDASASIEELRWAASKYAGDTKVGDRYFDVKYDNEHFLKGAPKQVTVAGFNLRNILQHGGVCADQAYFASHIGKAIGVPTSYVFGRNAESSHAWVGYLGVRSGSRPQWNFDSGRYPGYRGVRGTVTDPQTRRRVPDSSLSLMADSSVTSADNRRIAVAFTDASLRMTILSKGASPFPPAEPSVYTKSKPVRTTALADRLDVLEAGLKRCPTYSPAWDILVESAQAGELSLKHKKRWAENLDKLCAGKYPDFSLDIFRAMVQTIDNPQEQSKMWDALFSGYQNRPDLAAEIRIAQGLLWEKAGDRSKAWDCYQDILARFADDGPFTVSAAQRSERLLRDAGKDRDVLPMFAALWPRLTEPRSAAPEFRGQSNWTRIGLLYLAALEREGQTAKAAELRSKLGLPKP